MFPRQTPRPWRSQTFTVLVFVAAGTALSWREGTAERMFHGQLAQSQQAQARPTSYELIDDALAKRAIDEESANTYRVFAAFGDSRLPAAYRGVIANRDAVPPSVARIGALLPTFSAATRSALEPFFRRPNEPGSWYALRTVTREPGEPPGLGGPDHGMEIRETIQSNAARNLISFSAANGSVKIWVDDGYPMDVARAQLMARAIDIVIWPTLTKFFWMPIDAAGGGTFEIYLVRLLPAADIRDLPYYMVTVSRPPHGCHKNGMYLMLDPRTPVGSASDDGMVHGVASGLMKAIAYTVPLRGSCSQYDWLLSAMMVWADHYVYRFGDFEHGNARPFLREPEASLDDDDKRHAEGAYLFPLYLQFSRGDSLAIPAMWRQFEFMDVRDGINAALGSFGKTLEDVYPQFAVANWNGPSASPSYRGRDRLTMGAAWRDSVVVKLPPNGEYTKQLPLDLPTLSAMYYYFAFDSTVGTVAFSNSLTPVKHARVWGVQKIKGKWLPPADWSRMSGKSWCLAASGEELEELVLVFSNVEWKDKRVTIDPVAHTPVVVASAAGCGGWVGWDSVTATYAAAGVTITDTVVAQLEFDVNPALKVEGVTPEHWILTAGYLTWNSSYSGRGCTGTGSGATLMLRNTADHDAALRIYYDGPTLRYEASSAPWPQDPVPSYQVTCPNNHKLDQMLMTQVYFATDPVRNEMAPDGKSFSGRFVMPGTAGMYVQHVYSFRCRGC